MNPVEQALQAAATTDDINELRGYAIVGLSKVQNLEAALSLVKQEMLDGAGEREEAVIEDFAQRVYGLYGRFNVELAGQILISMMRGGVDKAPEV